MAQLKINERGSHTSVIECAKPILMVLRKLEVEISPGVIQGNVQARSKSLKLRWLNAGTMELILVAGKSKQTFKIYGSDQTCILKSLKRLHVLDWRVRTENFPEDQKKIHP